MSESILKNIFYKVFPHIKMRQHTRDIFLLCMYVYKAYILFENFLNFYFVVILYKLKSVYSTYKEEQKRISHYYYTTLLIYK